MGLLDYLDPDAIRGKLKGLLGGMPVSQLATGQGQVSMAGLLDRLRGMPVFDAESGAQDAFGAGLNALTFAGVGAKTADKAALARAQKMAGAGADRGAIWNETGWFKGPEGKWRFEIDDSAAKLNFDALPEGKSVYEIADWKLGEMPAYQGTKPGLRIGNPKVKGEDQSWALKWAQDNPQTPEPLPLSSVLDHKGLLDAYGDFDGLKVGRQDGMNYLGSFDREANAIRTGGATIGGSSNPRSTALHELQHAIQNREGFSGGGNPDNAPQMLYEATADATKRLRNLQNGEAYLSAQKKVKDLAKTWDADPVGYDAKLNTLKKKYPEYWEAQRLERFLYPARPISSADDAYRHLAGEAEARAVQARMDFPPDKRKAVPPWESYDIPWDQLIVRY